MILAKERGRLQSLNYLNGGHGIILKDGLPQRREHDDVTHVSCFKLTWFFVKLMVQNGMSAGSVGRDGTTTAS